MEIEYIQEKVLSVMRQQFGIEKIDLDQDLGNLEGVEYDFLEQIGLIVSYEDMFPNYKPGPNNGGIEGYLLGEPDVTPEKIAQHIYDHLE